MNKKILLVSHELSLTGAPLVLLRVATILRKKGFLIDLFSYKFGALKSNFEDLGIQVAEIRDRSRFLIQISRKQLSSYALIICNTVMTYKAVDVFQRYNIPVIWYIHESSIFLEKLIDEKREVEPILRNFYNIYTVSDYTKKCLSKYNNNCKVINNCVEDCFCGYSPKNNKIRFGFIGSIIKEKGVNSLIDAFLRLKECCDNISLSIAGNYENEFGLKLKTAISDKKEIKWLGPVKDRAKDEFFSSIDILCVPSDEESSSLVLFEAASRGLAVIATEKNGACSIIRNRLDSLVIPSNDCENLYNAMLCLVKNPNKVDYMKKAMRENYLSCATIDIFQQNLLKMVNDNIDNLPVVSNPLYLERFKIFQQIRTSSGFRDYYFCEKKFFSIKLK
ncbi:Glycosyl-transferase family 4 [Succinivibrio dextrinosolvens DSM 3072]|uniref:Glycosyl-transferase family 4 n=1 Tax=Succinivibrio dextrinosolvens DSM 3072 TaxID=1123324 RepID=A0A1T4VBJ5_9GAMM|nr:glycosyltransferase family 4 protein [Succinivibrio dextrinosolvens]SKA62340.1 Glycosyl-transferase family 4 [Succinivibrio dextrinosolvens DSM 3072]